MRPICLLALVLAAPAGAQTLLEELSETGRFDRFVAGVEAAGLERELSGAVTVLAPTDEAVGDAPDLAEVFDGDPDLARRVLLTHIAPGAAHAADALPRTLGTASGETVTISFEAGRLAARVDGGAVPQGTATIGGGEVRAGGGVAHPLTALLLPQDATLEALAGAAEVAVVAVAPAEEAPEEDMPIPEDGTFLDEVVGEPDPGAVAEAPVAESVDEEGAAVVTLTPEAGAGAGEPQVFTTAPEAAAPAEPAPAETAQTPAEAEAVEAPRVAEGIATGLDAAAGAAEGDATVIVEDLDVVVEAEPRVEPRTVAPSEMTGDPVPAGRPGGGPEQTGGGGSGPSQAEAEGSPPRAEGEEALEEEILTATIVGWPVFGPEGEEVGAVEELVMVKETGAVEAVLVEVDTFLGTGLGGKLVRLGLDELRVDAADEALIASVPGEEITGRPEYEGPELDP